jgi:hypothetical protein
MDKYQIAFNFLLTLNREHLKKSGNKKIYSAPLLKQDSNSTLDHGTCDEVIIFLVQKDLIGINKTALPDSVESYYIKNKGSVTLEKFMESERFKTHIIQTNKYNAELSELGEAFGVDELYVNKSHKIYIEWDSLLTEYFSKFETPLERQLVVENIYNVVVHDSTIPPLNTRQSNAICKHCFYLYDVDSHRNEGETISLARRYLISIL